VTGFAGRRPRCREVIEVKRLLNPRAIMTAAVEPGQTVHVDVTLNNVNGFTILGPAALLLSGPADLMAFTTLAGCDAAGGCTTGSFGSGPIGYKGILPEAISGGESATVGFDITFSPVGSVGHLFLQGPTARPPTSLPAPRRSPGCPCRCGSSRSARRRSRQPAPHRFRAIRTRATTRRPSSATS
jgi:hypothetical protein